MRGISEVDMIRTFIVNKEYNRVINKCNQWRESSSITRLDTKDGYQNRCPEGHGWSRSGSARYCTSGRPVVIIALPQDNRSFRSFTESSLKSGNEHQAMAVLRRPSQRADAPEIVLAKGSAKVRALDFFYMFKYCCGSSHCLCEVP